MLFNKYIVNFQQSSNTINDTSSVKTLSLYTSVIRFPVCNRKNEYMPLLCSNVEKSSS